MKAVFESAFEDFVFSHQLLEERDTVIVALSGGADSVCLLSALCSLRDKMQLHLMALHIHHGIRGTEADRDEAFCEKLCRDLNVPFFSEHICVLDEVEKTGETIEQAARRMRYTLFDSYARNYKAKIATAHSRSDHTETVFMHMIRGSGLSGLKGIPVKRDYIIRPLLFAGRDQIEAYCQSGNLSYVIDSTNLDTTYTRNRVRKTILPECKEINSKLEESIARMSRILQEDDDCLNEIASSVLTEAKKEDGKVDVHILNRAPKAIRVRVLRKMFSDVTNFEEKHFEMMDTLLSSEGEVTLPGGILFCSKAQEAWISKKEEDFPYFEYPYCVSEEICIAGEIYSSKVFEIEQFNSLCKVNKLLINYGMDYDKLIGDLVVRQRLNGDAYHPVNRHGKSLKKLYNEASFSQFQRQTSPVLCDDLGIVMVHNFGCDERVKITSSTSKVLVFTTNTYLK